jgi:hypothetical protein
MMQNRQIANALTVYQRLFTYVRYYWLALLIAMLASVFIRVLTHGLFIFLSRY